MTHIPAFNRSINILYFSVVVDCGNLQNPRFGRVVLTGTTFGSTATYSCQGGYILVGGSTRTCQANGQWSGVAPVCRGILSLRAWNRIRDHPLYNDNRNTGADLGGVLRVL